MGGGGEDAFYDSWTNGIAHLRPVCRPVIRKYWRRSFHVTLRDIADAESAMPSLRQKRTGGQAMMRHSQSGDDRHRPRIACACVLYSSIVRYKVPFGHGQQARIWYGVAMCRRANGLMGSAGAVVTPTCPGIITTHE